eukprot:c27034_g1_i3 orf=381-788(-)
MSNLVDHDEPACHQFSQTMQIPECPVCWDHFNEGAHMPRILRCGHTICNSCLKYLPVDYRLGLQFLRCPECRNPCLWKGEQELPKNYVLLRALSNSSLASEEVSKDESPSKTWNELMGPVTNEIGDIYPSKSIIP